MAKTSSKREPAASGANPNKTAVPQPNCSVSPQESPRSAKKGKFPLFITKFTQKITKKRADYRKNHVVLHRSFHRSYREDYQREVNAPGLLNHAMTTFGVIFKHWKTFLPFILLMAGLYIVLVGLMSEEFYQELQTTIDETNGESIGNFAKSGLLLLSTITTGGLTTGKDDIGFLFTIILFLIMWLVTIYLLRKWYAGAKLKLRDALYNALTPLISTLLVFLVIFIQCIPAMLVAITLSAARVTGFLSTPFYALVYFIFAALMITITGYLLSSSLIALVAVTVPGVYPVAALTTASDLMASRRIKLIIRALYLLFVVIVIYIVTILPIMLIDLWLKGIWSWLANVPIVPFCLLVVTCFVFIYTTTYLYRYYRWLLGYQD